MNPKYFEVRIAKLKADMEAAMRELDKAAANTRAILDAASRHKCDRIAIGVRDDECGGADWPFSYSGSIFCTGEKNGWPKAWAIAESSRLSSGCGNPDQHNVKGPLIDGVYVCRGGKWERQE